MRGGGRLLSMLLGGGSGTAGEMTIRRHSKSYRCIRCCCNSSDSESSGGGPAADNLKGYLSVWRRVDPGTYAVVM